MSKKGSVLIIVLWSIFILGALAVTMAGYVSAQINLAKRLSDGAKGYYLARGGIERSILEVKNDSTADFDALTDSWSNNDAIFKDVKLGDRTYSVLPLSGNEDGKKKIRYGLSDEERKVNVNKASKDVLKNLLYIAAGLDAEDAASIAASIINWRSPADHADKDGAGTFHYQTLDRPYKCKNAPIEVLEELLLVKGITPEIFNKIKPSLTIYGAGAVNINTADEVVLRSIGMSQELAGKIAHFRAPVTADSANIFDDTSKITALLAKKESLSDEESGKISNLIGAGLLSVSSDNFGGISVYNTVKIAFIFDRKNNAIRYCRACPKISPRPKTRSRSRS